jgi:hypothetical protein
MSHIDLRQNWWRHYSAKYLYLRLWQNATMWTMLIESQWWSRYYHSPWSKLSFLVLELSPSPSMSTKSLFTSESFRALSVTSTHRQGNILVNLHIHSSQPMFAVNILQVLIRKGLAYFKRNVFIRLSSIVKRQTKISIQAIFITIPVPWRKGLYHSIYLLFSVSWWQWA